MLECTAHVFSFWHGKVRPQKQCRDNARLYPLAIYFVAYQLRENTRALRVPDQNHTAALVVVFEIVVPRINHVLVTKNSIHCHRFASDPRAKSRKGYLAVERSEDAAHRAEAGKLRADHPHLFGTRVHITVRRRVVRDRRIHVKTIDRRIRLWSPLLYR